MKDGLVLFGLALAFLAFIVVGVVAATASYAQPPQSNATGAAAKQAHVTSPAAAGVQHGSVGGPVNKGAKVNGTGMRPKH